MERGLIRLVILLGAMSLIGCADKPTDHPVLQYYPPERIFEDGYVNKYYEHYEPVNGNERKLTRISYGLFQKTSANAFVIKQYNAGFDLTGTSHYRVADSSIHIDSVVSIWREDTTNFEIHKDLVYSLDTLRQEDEHYQLLAQNEDGYFQLAYQQNDVYDSVINEKPAKVFTRSSRRWNVQGQDTTVFTWNDTSYYVAGIGYFGEVERSDSYVWRVELAEQMPLSKFKKMANHDRHRVAYIDPDLALDKGEDFSLCGHERFIADYYNSEVDGNYGYGKAAMVDTILNHFDASKMLNQTGMLTFRFVVNCEGQAGRFVAEGYDLDFQSYTFPDETVAHLYGIIRKLTKWNPVVIREESRDAYFYITFKLSNGEITDILP